jgi:uncharacterized membrane protein YcaP (DUF421 family)
MFAPAEPWWSFVVRTLVVYLALTLGLRAFGRRELGQMNPFDLVVILLIANSLQNAMVGDDVSIGGGLIGAFTLLVANWLLARLRAKFGWLQRVFEGEPVLLISGGKVLKGRLRQQNIEIEELEQAVREHGLADLSQVDTAVLEVDGTISIIPLTESKVSMTRKAGTNKSRRDRGGAS